MARPLEGQLKEERNDEDEAHDEGDEQGLQGGPGRVHELPVDHVQHWLVCGPVAMPGIEKD